MRLGFYGRDGCTNTRTHKRSPSTVQCGGFCLLPFGPEPVRLSLHDLDSRSAPVVHVDIGLGWTPVLHALS